MGKHILLFYPLRKFRQGEIFAALDFKVILLLAYKLIKQAFLPNNYFENCHLNSVSSQWKLCVSDLPVFQGFIDEYSGSEVW